MDEIKKRIEKVLKEDVAPELEKDGGDITLVDFKNGVATVRFKGACMGCPMAAMTLGNVVEGILRKKVKEVKAVQMG
jgi:Fe-S cluster biogenesis protein NfuA